jgi:hypothetical protein
MAGYLLPDVGRAVGGLLRSECSLICDFRWTLYAGDRMEWKSSILGLDDPVLIPVWACAIAVSAGSA